MIEDWGIIWQFECFSKLLFWCLMCKDRVIYFCVYGGMLGGDWRQGFSLFVMIGDYWQFGNMFGFDQCCCDFQFCFCIEGGYSVVLKIQDEYSVVVGVLLFVEGLGIGIGGDFCEIISYVVFLLWCGSW